VSELLIGEMAASDPRVEARLDARNLTTHGVILGMTGSGKTGLAVVVLEELARRRVPLVVCDLKGDLVNLLLTFPRLAAEDFLPYVPASVAAGDRPVAARATADTWRRGLAGWGLGEAEIRQVRESLDWRLLTPGSGLAPVDLLPALQPPPGYDPDVDPDGARASLDGTAAAVLALVDRGGDPLSDRDHVLLATLLDAAWRAGRGLDFAALVRQVAEPPVQRFGVLDAESFYPRRERQQLVGDLNTLLASPAFGVWARGVPLAVDELIGPPDRPRGTILYLAHLGDRERISFLALLFSTILGWARRQPGSEELRLLLYLDEVQGIVPPSAQPATKRPLLTLFKQGRAFGAGVLVATQNPVDLDYKALGNAGVKLVGRLDTENDRRRALEGLDLAGADLDERVAGLGKRQFLLAGARVGEPRVIASRWAMSYLRGPLTLAELKPLLGAPGPQAAAAPPPPAGPPVLPGVEQLFGAGAELRPALLVEAEVGYRKASPAVARTVRGTWLAPIEGDRVAWERLALVAEPALDGEPRPDTTLAGLPASAAALVGAAAREFAGEMDSRPLEVAWHRGLKLVQDEGEADEAFAARCRRALEDAYEDRRERLRGRYRARLDKVDARAERERLELERDRSDLAARERAKTMSVVEGVGDVLLSGLGSLLGGRRGGAGGAVRRGAGKLRQYQEKDRMADRAQAEVDESVQALAALDEERRVINDELEAELAALDSELARDAGAVEKLSLVPARKDIAVRRMALAWLAPDQLP